MKFDDIKKLTAEELGKKHEELLTELMKLNAQVAIGTTPKSTKQIREIKRTLARIQTFKKQTLNKELKELRSVSRRYIHS